MIWWFRQLLLVRDVLRARAPARQVALGCACGLLLGLVPKANLLAPVLAMLLLALRLHMATYVLTALVTSLVAPLTDPITHRVGYFLLTEPHLAVVWQWLYRQPLVAWTALNNTVVMGSLIFSLLEQ